MKKFVKYFFIIGMISLVTFTGCKKDEDPEAETSFTTLKNYMVSNGMDLTDLLSGWVIAADLIDGETGIVDPTDYTIPGYYTFDIRSQEDFDAGHIKGAMRSSLQSILVDAEGKTDKPILIVCKTGQTAGHAVMALRLSGYANAKVLKWGMAGWNEAFAAPWENSTSDQAVGNANWTSDASPAFGSYDDPSWSSTSTDGATILSERVDAMLNGGFKTASGATTLSDPAAAGQIMNFWDNGDYTTFGHFVGAYQIKPISLANDVTKAMDPSMNTLIYCYTGQTSSMATAWLNVLGYNASSITFGVNGLSYTALYDASKPTWHGAHDYDYVTTK